MAPTLFDNPPKPGDLIEIMRGPYKHWAVYIGQSEVVHLSPPSVESDGFSNLLVLLDNNKAQVKRQEICEVVGSDSFHVNNLLDDRYQPRERHVIVKAACQLVGRELPYCFVSYNCEHFVTDLRYGRPQSRQVKTALAIGGAAAGVATVALGAALLFAFLKDDDEDEKNLCASRKYKP